MFERLSGMQEVVDVEIEERSWSRRLVGSSHGPILAPPTAVARRLSLMDGFVEMRVLSSAALEHFSIRLGVPRVCEISFAFFFGNTFEKKGDCSPKLAALPVQCRSEIDAADDSARVNSHAWNVQRLAVYGNWTSLRPRTIRVALKVCTSQLDIRCGPHCRFR
jgi:hypothetical protein